MSNTVREGIFWAKSGTTGSQAERDRDVPARGQKSGHSVGVLDAPQDAGPNVQTSNVTPPRRDDSTR